MYCWRPDCYSAAPPAGSSSVAVAKTDTYGQLGDQSWSATHKVRLWVDMNPVPGRKGEHSWHNMQSQQNIVQPTACGRNCKAISQTCTVIGRQAEKYLQNCSGASRVSSSQHNTCSALQRSNQGVQPWNPEQIPLTQRVYHLIRKKETRCSRALQHTIHWIAPVFGYFHSPYRTRQTSQRDSHTAKTNKQQTIQGQANLQKIRTGEKKAAGAEEVRMQP